MSFFMTVIMLVILITLLTRLLNASTTPTPTRRRRLSPPAPINSVPFREAMAKVIKTSKTMSSRPLVKHTNAPRDYVVILGKKVKRGDSIEIAEGFYEGRHTVASLDFDITNAGNPVFILPNQKSGTIAGWPKIDSITAVDTHDAVMARIKHRSKEREQIAERTKKGIDACRNAVARDKN